MDKFSPEYAFSFINDPLLIPISQKATMDYQKAKEIGKELIIKRDVDRQSDNTKRRNAN